MSLIILSEIEKVPKMTRVSHCGSQTIVLLYLPAKAAHTQGGNDPQVRQLQVFELLVDTKQQHHKNVSLCHALCTLHK